MRVRETWGSAALRAHAPAAVAGPLIEPEGNTICVQSDPDTYDRIRKVNGHCECSCPDYQHHKTCTGQPCKRQLAARLWLLDRQAGSGTPSEPAPQAPLRCRSPPRKPHLRGSAIMDCYFTQLGRTPADGEMAGEVAACYRGEYPNQRGLPDAERPRAGSFRLCWRITPLLLGRSCAIIPPGLAPPRLAGALDVAPRFRQPPQRDPPSPSSRPGVRWPGPAITNSSRPPRWRSPCGAHPPGAAPWRWARAGGLPLLQLSAVLGQPNVVVRRLLDGHDYAKLAAL